MAKEEREGRTFSHYSKMDRREEIVLGVVNL